MSAVIGGGLLVVGACDAQREGQDAGQSGGGTPPSELASSTIAVTMPVTTASVTTSSASATRQRTTTTKRDETTTSRRRATTTAEPRSTTTNEPRSTTTKPRRTTTTRPRPTTTTTVPAPLPGVHNPRCVVKINPGDSLSEIVEAIAGDVSVDGLQGENAIAEPDRINAGDYLDICVGNDIDDVTGDERVPEPTPPPVAGRGSGVQAQQQQLNELLAGHGMPALDVDGDSGRLTEQQLCAARVALGQPVSRADMEPGGAEERALMAADALPIPPTAPVSAARWVLIDRTCQVMFVGEGSDRLVFVLPASTGEPGHETRDQNGSPVFRFDPARENNGWHDSSSYPVPADNPLNGNMYMPLYFDDGQAIHGANYVPPEPQSKGCVRLRVESQDALVNWLGLSDVAEPIWDPGRIDLTVNVQGRF